MSAVAERVIVAVAADDFERANQMCEAPGVSIIVGGERRSDTFQKLVAQSISQWLLLHDIAHPFVSIDLALRVMDAVELTGCAAAAMPNVDFLYDACGSLRARPGELMIAQKPVAFSRSAAIAGLRLARESGLTQDLGVLDVLSLAGVNVTFVPGYTTNFKITTVEDLKLARALMASGLAPPSSAHAG
jgi:2-C-methyl-D-erythritol 4-phosphate cytidylyltransferase